MKYQIAWKKTYKDKPDVDEFFFVNRTEDVTLSNILEIEDYDLPKNDTTLDNAINRYNELLVALDQGLEDGTAIIKELQEVQKSLNEAIAQYSDRLEKIELHMEAAEAELSNQGNYMGALASTVAEQGVMLAQHNAKIDDLGVKNAVQEKTLNDTVSKVDVLEDTVANLSNSDNYIITEASDEAIKALWGKNIEESEEG